MEITKKQIRELEECRAKIHDKICKFGKKEKRGKKIIYINCVSCKMRDICWDILVIRAIIKKIKFKHNLK